MREKLLVNPEKLYVNTKARMESCQVETFAYYLTESLTFAQANRAFLFTKAADGLNTGKAHESSHKAAIKAYFQKAQRWKLNLRASGTCLFIYESSNPSTGKRMKARIKLPSKRASKHAKAHGNKTGMHRSHECSWKSTIYHILSKITFFQM